LELDSGPTTTPSGEVIELLEAGEPVTRLPLTGAVTVMSGWVDPVPEPVPLPMPGTGDVPDIAPAVDAFAFTGAFTAKSEP